MEGGGERGEVGEGKGGDGGREGGRKGRRGERGEVGGEREAMEEEEVVSFCLSNSDGFICL